jgi:hypothetical protein
VDHGKYFLGTSAAGWLCYCVFPGIDTSYSPTTVLLTPCTSRPIFGLLYRQPVAVKQGLLAAEEHAAQKDVGAQLVAGDIQAAANGETSKPPSSP